MNKKLPIPLLIVFAFLLLTPIFVFAANPGEACFQAADCTTQGSSCVQNQCSYPQNAAPTPPDYCCVLKNYNATKVTSCYKVFGANASCTDTFHTITGTVKAQSCGTISECVALFNQNSSQMNYCCVEKNTQTSAITKCTPFTSSATACNSTFGSVTSQLLKQSCDQISDCVKALGATPPPTQPAAPAPTQKETPFVPIEPKLQINIPTIQWTKASTEGGYATLPYLADYIAGIYKYAVGIVSIIAIIMIMVGGLRWLTAGGNASAIGGAKEMISGAAIGLILLLGSYTVLYIINPNLVTFGDLKIKLIQPEQLDVIDSGDVCGGVSAARNPKAISDTTYDSLFQKYGQSTGVDWRILKAIAYQESRLVPTLINPKSGATGLFQIMPDNCPGGQEACKDSDYNTNIGAKMIKASIAAAQKSCPNANQQILFTLVYMSHNSGSGAVYCATHKTCTIETIKGTRTSETTNGGCSLEEIKQGIMAFWSKHYKANASGAGPDRGIRTFNYSVATANVILGLTGGSAAGSINETFICPKNTAPSNSGGKILAIGDSITAAGGSWAYKLKSAGYAVDVVAQSGQQTLWMWQQVSNQDFNGYTYVMVLGGINDIYSSGNGVQNAENNLTKIYQKAQAAGAKVVAITIPPSKGYVKWTSPTIQNRTVELNSWIMSHGDYKIDFNGLIKDPSDSEQQSATYSSADHLHPNSTAHQLLANTIIQNVLSK